jgi:hypothetical protein
MFRKFALVTLAVLAVAAAPIQLQAQCTGWPSNTTLTPGSSFSDTISVSGLAFATYYIQTSVTGSAGIINLGITALPGFTQGTQKGFVGTGTTLYLSFVMANTALPGRTSTITSRVYNSAGATVCSNSFVVTVAGDACPLDAFWLDPNPTAWNDGTNVDAWYDGANCYVHAFPTSDGSFFVYNNAYYVSRGPNGFCEAGWFDGANCLLGWAPQGKNGFKYGTSFYYQP